jgi:hypothetical protein
MTQNAGSTATLLIWPWGANARTSLASAVLGTEANPALLAEARRSAILAVDREPADVKAVRTLALIDAQRNQLSSADQLMNYAHTLSRRDLPTEMYLIERLVQANNVSGTLLHYDHALRTSRKSADILMPILVQAITDKSVRIQLATLLRAYPSWRYDFFGRVLSNASDLSALQDLMRRAELRSAEPGGATFIRQLVDRLITAGRYADAFAAYRSATRDKAFGLVRDGGFETANAIPPIDWWFSDNTAIYAVRESVPEARGRYALRVVAKDGGSNVFARQLLMLTPNTYQLTGQIGGAGEGANVTVRIICATAVNLRVAEMARRLVPDRTQRFGLSVSIGKDCPAQWLTFETTAPDLGETTFWVDDVAIIANR